MFIKSHSKTLSFWQDFCNDVKRGQNLEAKAKARATRPRLISRGWGQGQGKNDYKKVPNND